MSGVSQVRYLRITSPPPGVYRVRVKVMNEDVPADRRIREWELTVTQSIDGATLAEIDPAAR
jgi:hypothetical protein